MTGTTATTAVDLSPLIQVVLSFLAVVLPALGAYIAWLIKQRMNIQANSAAAQAVDAAVQRGAGVAYSLLVQTATNAPHTIQMRNAAVAAGVNDVLKAVPDSIKLREEDGTSLGNMVAGELGKLEAADPNVSTVKTAPVVSATTVSTVESTPTGGTTTTTTVKPAADPAGIAGIPSGVPSTGTITP